MRSAWTCSAMSRSAGSFWALRALRALGESQRARTARAASASCSAGSSGKGRPACRATRESSASTRARGAGLSRRASSSSAAGTSRPYSAIIRTVAAQTSSRASARPMTVHRSPALSGVTPRQARSGGSPAMSVGALADSRSSSGLAESPTRRPDNCSTSSTAARAVPGSPSEAAVPAGTVSPGTTVSPRATSRSIATPCVPSASASSPRVRPWPYGTRARPGACGGASTPGRGSVMFTRGSLGRAAPRGPRPRRG